MMNWIRTALAGGGLLVAGASFVAGNLTGEQVKPTSIVSGSGSDRITAASICQKPETQVYRVTDPASGEQHFQARYEDASVRYDLTWQVDPSVVAVEELRGASFTPWVEQWSPEMSNCLRTKTIEDVEGGH